MRIRCWFSLDLCCKLSDFLSSHPLSVIFYFVDCILFNLTSHISFCSVEDNQHFSILKLMTYCTQHIHLTLTLTWDTLKYENDICISCGPCIVCTHTHIHMYTRTRTLKVAITNIINRSFLSCLLSLFSPPCCNHSPPLTTKTNSNLMK